MKILTSSYIEKPQKVFFDGEDSDEEIILMMRKHFATNTGWVLVSLFLILIPFFFNKLLLLGNITLFDTLPPAYKFIISICWFVFTFGFIFNSFLSWYFNVCLVTNKRLIDIDFIGLTHRRFSEAFLFNVEDLTHQISGALQVIFNYGTIHIQTAGELRELEFESVPHPAVAQDVISDLAAKMKRGRRHDNA